ncbi:MAG TPA: helix-turn-helix domain-containing protein [Aldersonia sp.]
MTTTHTDTLALLPVGITSRMPEILDDLTATVLREVSAFQRDEEVATRLRASIEANVSMLTHVMQHAGDLRALDAPRGAVDFALWIAQRGLPFSALLRAYNLCTARFYELCLQELAQQGPHTDTVIQDAGRLSTILHSYVDHVCERISKSYDTERERWLRQFDVTRADRVLALLDRQPADLRETEADLRYPVTGHHLGLIAWNTSTTPDGNELLRLQHLVSAFADALDCNTAPLVLPRDNTTLWAWLPVPQHAHHDVEEILRGLLVSEGQARVALGHSADAAEGFARTHEQAAAAQTVALIAGGHSVAVTPYDTVSSISFLCSDLDTARLWVAETLGDLAIGSTHHQRLRETLEVFLDCGGSFTAAAERLFCHKNTVQYRIRKAEEARGQPIRHRRLDLELALLACKWLGPIVLTSNHDGGTPVD